MPRLPGTLLDVSSSRSAPKLNLGKNATFEPTPNAKRNFVRQCDLNGLKIHSAQRDPISVAPLGAYTPHRTGVQCPDCAPTRV